VYVIKIIHPQQINAHKNRLYGTVTATTQNGGTLSLSSLSTKQTSALKDIGGQADVTSANDALSTSGCSQYDGTYFFGGAGIDGDYIADMVTAFQEVGIADVHAVDGIRWSMNDGEFSILGTGFDAFIGVLALNEEIDLGDRINTTPERLINRCDGKGQFNLVGYSYGSLVAA
jgi:hypothetical protein